jgi:MFS family permease
LGGQLLLKFSFRSVLTAGMLLGALGFFLMSTMGIDSNEYTAYAYMVVLGLGMGLVMPTLMIAIQNEFPKSQLGTVTSASTFFRSIGGTIGITILNSIMNHTLKGEMISVANDAENPIAHKALTALSEKTDSLFSLLLNPSLLKMPEDIQNSVIHGIQIAWSDSFSTVFLTGLIFIAVGVLVALAVGKGRIKKDNELKDGSEQPIPSFRSDPTES